MRIVVGVDSSTAARSALQWALHEAVRRSADVHVVHAWVDPVTAGFPVATAALVTADDVQRTALDVAEHVVKETVASVPGADMLDVTVDALRGAASPVLCEASRGADLLVVGTRAANALSRVVLGSVTASVLHHAGCPVAVVPEPRPAGQRAPRVVAGVDHSPASLAALRWAAEHAAARDAVLVPVFVRQESVDHVPALAYLEDNERHALERSVPDDVVVQVEPEILAGHSSAALLDAVEPQDVLVVGSRGRGGFASLLLGSTSLQVATHAPCPVVVVRQP